MFHASKELPRVEKELEDLVEIYKEKSGQSFLVKGRTVSDYILDHWHRYHDQRNQEKKERVSFPTQHKYYVSFGIGCILV